MSLTINWGQGINQKAMAYEAHEFVFITGLNGFAGMTQEQADFTCQENFRALREQGIFDENVARNTWHIWAHLNNRHCVMNIRNKPSEIKNIDWKPSNNTDKIFNVRIPRFN